MHTPLPRWVIFVGGDRGRGPVYVRSTSDRVGILCTAVKDAKCRYCCKSPKLPAANFSAVKKSDPRSSIDLASYSITLSRRPFDLVGGGEHRRREVEVAA